MRGVRESSESWERLGKGGGDRREGGKEGERTAESPERLREGGEGRRVGGERKEGWVGKEERRRSAENPPGELGAEAGTGALAGTWALGGGRGHP